MPTHSNWRASAARGNALAWTYWAGSDAIYGWGVDGVSLSGAFAGPLAIATCGFVFLGATAGTSTTSPIPSVMLSTFRSSLPIQLAPIASSTTPGQRKFRRIAADDTAVYWSDASGAIGRLPL